MPNKFWTTFRLKQDATYSTRYDELTATLRRIGNYLWVEPTSFCAFETDLDIDDVALQLSGAVNENTDLVLIREVGVKDARYIGTPEYPATFASYFPEAKKV